MTMPSKTGETDRLLSTSINIATRSVHTKLNKLVITRLSLALPPEASDASSYVSGLLHIAPVYIAFESLWRDIVSVAEGKDNDKNGITVSPTEATDAFVTPPESPRSHSTSGTPAVRPPIQSLLTYLHLPGLVRSQALKEDLIALTGWSNPTLAEHLDDNAQSPVLAEFLAHINDAVTARPHVLLAYAWVLYMALFSGGRFIRASLEAIDPAFWTPACIAASSATHPSSSSSPSHFRKLSPFASPSSPSSSSAQPTPPPSSSQAQSSCLAPFEFFHFDTPTDGEDLKQTFKSRLSESEALFLAPAERDEVVEEARTIFDYMIRMVAELDEICGTDREQEAEEASSGGGGISRLLSLRSRDSVVVEKERERKKLAKLVKQVAGGQGNRGNSGKGEGKEGCVRFR
ncbi:hypothetical protein F4778DRAFT_46060 [Xylariomycetidae sp. FL2044]|nr:hypothetical protein F4778DRAFT_46060 [Xylariomycetidae sp. FL2044]